MTKYPARSFPSTLQHHRQEREKAVTVGHDCGVAGKKSQLGPQQQLSPKQNVHWQTCYFRHDRSSLLSMTHTGSLKAH
ncbi:hypothetical protein RvY_03524 [Ramazzottius varieornatus]|uniref:Uncharacterized protein n=1 Tax=Ramazzottius varieornatus TaxID=947166 RepID=A0A1D1UXQ5_RAMVA|nr:hypothetical protein RvY_03524 [Ramazzottius varieornatus]